MPTSIRSKNLDLIRWLNFSHENTAKKLASVTNATYLSKMATGDMQITDRKARQIEKTLDLPTGWLDRDNVSLLKMSAVDFDIWHQLAPRSDSAKRGLLAFVAEA